MGNLYKLLVILLVLSRLGYSQNKELDSLEQAAGNLPEDTTKVKAYINLSGRYASYNPPKSLSFAQLAKQLSQKIKYDKGYFRATITEASALSNSNQKEKALQIINEFEPQFNKKEYELYKGEYYLRKGFIEQDVFQFDKADSSFTKAEIVYLKQNDYRAASDCRRALANLASQLLDYETAIEQTHQAIKYAELSKNDEFTGHCYILLGNLIFAQKEYDRSVEPYSSALKYYQKAKSDNNIAGAYLALGTSYMQMSSLDSAENYFLKSYAIQKHVNNKNVISAILSNLGSVNVKKEDYEKAVEYSTLGLKFAYELQNPYFMAGTLNNLGIAKMELKNYKEAELLLKRSDSICLKNNFKSFELNAKKNLAKTYYFTGRFKEAYDLLNLSYSLHDTIDNADNKNKARLLEAKFQNQKRKAEIDKQNFELTRKENELSQVRFQRVLVIIILAFAIIFLLFLYNRYKLIKHQKSIIANQKEQVEIQKEDIELKQKEILDSISYAKRLQDAILPSEEELHKAFGQCAVIYKPKDIVSGDFYWFAESEENKILAVADCTGHGVPGAFMSMMGNEILQDVLLKENIKTTSDALNELNKRLTNALNKSKSEYRDGMDIVLCAFSKNENKVQFSGANRPLYKISKGELTEFTPTKSAIGGDLEQKTNSFNQEWVTYKKDDLFYLFSDGFADQFGGPNGKKFMLKRLKDLLLSISNLSVSEQKNLLMKEYDSWRGSLEQVDDVTLLIIKV